MHGGPHAHPHAMIAHTLNASMATRLNATAGDIYSPGLRLCIRAACRHAHRPMDLTPEMEMGSALALSRSSANFSIHPSVRVHDHSRGRGPMYNVQSELAVRAPVQICDSPSRRARRLYLPAPVLAWCPLWHPPFTSRADTAGAGALDPTGVDEPWIRRCFCATAVRATAVPLCSCY